MPLSRKLNLALKRLLGRRFAHANPIKIDLAQCRKVLVLELWGLGDLVFAAPAINALSAHGEGRSVDVLAQPSTKPLLDLLGLNVTPIFFQFPWTRFGNKYNPAHYLAPSFWRLILKLRAGRYDLILSVREDPRDALLARLIRPRHSLGYAAFGSGFFLTSSIDPKGTHKTEAWFRLLAFLGVQESANQAFRELQSGIRARRIPAASRKKTITLHCSARNPVRNWGWDNFVELGGLLEKEGYGILWLSDANSPSDKSIPDRWERLSGSLGEIASVIAACDLYFGNDGGLMHIVDLFGAKTCAVFGPTDPALFFPYGQRDSMVFLPDVPCRPCFDYCIYPKPICFNGITALQVRDKILRLLGASA